MAENTVIRKRNVVFLGHAHAGKTSLAESIIFACGTSSRKGKVEDGTTISDYASDEIERKISINSSILGVSFKNCDIHLIDTPGYADFVGQTIAAIRAADCVVIVIDAVSGVEVGTERVWALVQEQKLPCLIFINKLDKAEADMAAALKSIKEGLSARAMPLEKPYSKELIEAVAETDDALLEKYLDGKELGEAEIAKFLRSGIVQGNIFPVIGGSALSDQGVKELIEAIIEYLPSPSERPKLTLEDSETKEVKELEIKTDGRFLGFVFKTIADPYVGQLTVFRVFSGKLTANTSFYNLNQDSQERIGALYLLQGKEQRSVTDVGCGDIAAVAKLKDTSTAETISDAKGTTIFAPIIFPEPLISASVKPKSRQDEEKISIALAKLRLEDSTFGVSRDQQTKELIISGIGGLHLEIMVKRMKERFGVEVDLGTPKVPYKETITKSTKCQGKYKRQSGGRGQYGDVWIQIDPLPRSGDFEFVDKIFGGSIPKNYIPSVEKGVRQAMAEGAIAGFPVVDVRVTLYDGSYHDVDSSDMAFQIAGSMALRKAVLSAGPALLEPIMDVVVVISDDYMGQISGDIRSDPRESCRRRLGHQ